MIGLGLNKKMIVVIFIYGYYCNGNNKIMVYVAIYRDCLIKNYNYIMLYFYFIIILFSFLNSIPYLHPLNNQPIHF